MGIGLYKLIRDSREFDVPVTIHGNFAFGGNRWRLMGCSCACVVAEEGEHDLSRAADRPA